jgi:hypothetical protein
MARALVRLKLLPDWERVEPKRAEESEDAPAEAAAAAGDTGDVTAIPAVPFFRSRRGAITLAAAFSLVVLTLMDRWTVDSFTARAADVPGVPDGIPQYAREHGLDHVRGVLHLIREGAFYVPGDSNARMLEDLENACRLSLLHGIGTDNARRLIAAGAGSVEEVAASDARELTARLRELDEKGWRPRPQRVAVWIRAAQAEAAPAAQ